MADILVKDLSKRFGEVKALERFSAVFPQGETTCLMGRSGCGKTTLLNILMGLVKADSGTVTGLPERISAVFQEDRLLEGFSVLANLSLVCPKTPVSTLLSHLEEVGLAAAAAKPVQSLSGGMKRRVAMVRAMLAEGSLVILDEPFKGLDTDTRQAAAAYLQKHTRGKTVIMVTHDRDEVALLGGNCIVM